MCLSIASRSACAVSCASTPSAERSEFVRSAPRPLRRLCSPGGRAAIAILRGKLAHLRNEERQAAQLLDDTLRGLECGAGQKDVAAVHFGLRNVLEIRVDDQPHAAHPSASRI